MEALALIIAVTLIGCKKEKVSQSIPDKDNQMINSQKTQQWPYHYTGYETYYDYRHVVDHLGYVHVIYDPHCAFPYSGFCLPEVTIVADDKGNGQNELAILFMAYYEEGEVGLFFKSEDYLQLFPNLIDFPDIVKGVMEDEIVFFDRYNEHTSTHYYIALPRENLNDYLIRDEELGDLIEKEPLCTFEIRDLR